MTVSVKTAKKPSKENGTIRRKVLAMVEALSCRLTPGELRKRFFGKNVVDEKALKAAISGNGKKFNSASSATRADLPKADKAPLCGTGSAVI